MAKTGGSFYIASAFIQGATLQQELRDRTGTAPNLQRAIYVIRRMAEALGYAHGQGIVHRDVKPANKMIDAHGDPGVSFAGTTTLPLCMTTTRLPLPWSLVKTFTDPAPCPDTMTLLPLPWMLLIVTFDFALAGAFASPGS
ncbi:MAG: protein kinase [Gemmataceae bacterium]